jgi:uncharacterized membrane protein (TIGR02234 family)
VNRLVTRPAVVIGVLLGVGLVVLAGGRPWVSEGVTGVPGVTRVTASGNQVVPAVTALALVAAAGAVALALVGRLLRRIVAALLVLAGLGVLGLVATVLQDPTGAALPAVQNATGQVGSSPGTGADLTAWPWPAMAGGLLIAVAGAAGLVAAGRWAGSGRRYEAPGTGVPELGRPVGADATAPGVADRRPAGAGPAGAGPADGSPPSVSSVSSAARQARRDQDLDAWDALSRGEDPTAG